MKFQMSYTTSTNTMLTLRFSPFFLVAVLTLFVVPTSQTTGQTTTADNLYLAVQQAQAALGPGEAGDVVRDRFLIRELETESAKGFTADLALLQEAATQLGQADGLSQELVAVKAALDAHLSNLRGSVDVDMQGRVSALATVLEPVDLGVLTTGRDRTLESLKALDEYHQHALSYFGRHYLNKKLGFKDLVTSLKEFDFTVGDNQNQFNRDVNSLRNRLSNARRVFGGATYTHPGFKMANAEQQITELEQQIVAYLLYQSRRKASFEEMLQVRKQAFVSQDGATVPSDDRLFQAELGRWLAFLSRRDQADGLDAAVRRQFSRPNLRLSVRESMVNRLAAQPVSQLDYLDEVIVGSRAQGWTQTTGLVSLDFVDSPHSALVSIDLSGSLTSSAYSKEGPVTAYTSTAGSFQASRDVEVNVGNLTVYKPEANARVSTRFEGTNCIPLVTRIASNRFHERQWRAEEVGSERARDRVLGQFSDQSSEALNNGTEQLDARARQKEILDFMNQLRRDISEVLAEDKDGNIDGPYDLIDPFVLPRVFVTTTDSALHVGAVLEANNRLASGSEPPGETVPCDVRLQIHESMVSNLIAPFVQNRLIENWQFRNTVDSLASGTIELPEEDEDRPFAIRFEEGRPVQIEFDNNEIGITVFGREFRQGRNSYTDPLSIHVRLRVIRHDGQLKLSRATKALASFTYDPLKDKNWDVTFRSFLQDNLDAAIGDVEAPEDAMPLADDLLVFAEYIEDEEIRKHMENMTLVECSAEDGWLTLGWNYASGDESAFTTHTPGIQNVASTPKSTELSDSSPSDETAR